MLLFLSMLIYVKLLQPKNALRDSEVTLAGMDMDANLVHPRKANSLINVTPLLIVTLIKLLQPEKTYPSNKEIEAGIMIDVKLEQ